MNEIARMLRELKEEQNRWIALDEDEAVKESNWKPEQIPSTTSTSSSAESTGSNLTSQAEGITVFSDDDVQIRLNTQRCNNQAFVQLLADSRWIVSNPDGFICILANRFLLIV